MKNYTLATYLALSGGFSSTPPVNATAKVANGAVSLGIFPNNSLWNNTNLAQMIVEPRFNLSNGLCPVQIAVTRRQYIQDLVLNLLSENLVSGVNYTSSYPIDLETQCKRTVLNLLAEHLSPLNL